MKYRKLRIAWSGVWGVVAVLLVVFWVRSFWVSDGVTGQYNYTVIVSTLRGDLRIMCQSPSKVAPRPQIHSPESFHLPVNAPMVQGLMIGKDVRGGYGVRWNVFGNGWQILSSLVWLLLITFVLALSPWITLLPWSSRFSLRTLLIATTLVAVTLGVAVFLWNGLPDAHPAAVRSGYTSGKITLEQARQELGDKKVSKWTADIRERAKLMRDAKSAVSP